MKKIIITSCLLFCLTSCVEFMDFVEGLENQDHKYMTTYNLRYTSKEKYIKKVDVKKISVPDGKIIDYGAKPFSLKTNLSQADFPEIYRSAISELGHILASHYVSALGDLLDILWKIHIFKCSLFDKCKGK